MTYYIEELFVVRFNKRSYICTVDEDYSFKDVLSGLKIPIKESEYTEALKDFFPESALKKFGTSFRLNMDDLKKETELINEGKSFSLK